MAVIKKAFESDQLTLQEYLQNIRQLSSKQSKQVYKLQKINKAINANIHHQQSSAYDLGSV